MNELQHSSCTTSSLNTVIDTELSAATLWSSLTCSKTHTEKQQEYRYLENLRPSLLADQIMHVCL